MNIDMKTVKLNLLYRALVCVNAYKCAKFQFPSSNSYRDMEGSKNKNWKLLSPHTLPSEQILQVVVVPANAYQRMKFQLSSLISFGDMRGSQNKKWELLISPDAP